MLADRVGYNQIASNDINNLMPACIPCNSSKGAKLLSEWRRTS